MCIFIVSGTFIFTILNRCYYKKYKQKYLDGLNNLISLREKELAIKRQNYFKDIFKNQDVYREDFKKMLGVASRRLHT